MSSHAGEKGTDYTEVPQSRAEKILLSKINGTTYDEVPQSRLEYLLMQLISGGEGSGGGCGCDPTELAFIKQKINTIQNDLSELTEYVENLNSKISEIRLEIEASQSALIEGVKVNYIVPVEKNIAILKEHAILDSTFNNSKQPWQGMWASGGLIGG